MPTHFAFSDESQYCAGRFRSIAVVSVVSDECEPLQDEATAILQKCSVSELKWEKVRTARDRLAALAVIDWVLAQRDSISIDVLMWDIEDARHSIKGRDDIENLHRMHHHVMKHVLTHRGFKGSRWVLRPDEHTAMRWKEVGEFLYYTSMETHIQRVLGETNKFKMGVSPKYIVEGIIPSISQQQPFVQIADIFAGMMVFSWKAFDAYRRWLSEQHGQEPLFAREEEQASRGETEKCKVLDSFHSEMKRLSAPISLISSSGLRTHAPRFPFNFWLYQPQTNMDKAPVRSGKR